MKRGMERGRSKYGLGWLPGGGGASSEGAAGRPWVFALLFWGALTASYLTHLVNVSLMRLYGGPERGPETLGALPATLAAAAVVACWLALPWDARVGVRRKLAAPAAFVACATVFGYLTGMTWAQALYLVAFANGIFLFGFRRGLAYSAAVLPVAFLGVLLSWQPDATPLRALYQTSILALAGAFVAGVCDAVVDAVRGREEKGRLLKELGAAHAELRGYAGRVRELSVAEERARIAREMHDSVGHHLTVANLQLQNAERFKTRRPDEAWEEVGEARKTTLEALAEVRRSVRALRPLGLEERSLAGAISALVRSFEGAGVEATFRAVGQEGELPGEARLVLYRAAQEGLTNAAKHAKARRVAVALAFEEGGVVRLSVADDGPGAEDGGSVGGFGLASLKERAEALGGAFAAGNRPGGGFALEVELPSAAAPAVPFAASEGT